ncbi:MAG: deoxyribonuclease V [Anaerolineae bacterium]|nr:deoxyribonuclease V [Anaerolineae bacterium]
MPAIANPNLHPWNLNPDDAVTLQIALASRLRTQAGPALADIRTVAGVDVSVRDEVSRAAIVVLRFPALTILEVSQAQAPTPFPYIPGLLSFREGQVILAAYERLTVTPDILIFDGQGQAHPRRLGIAAHIGLWLERPTVGCAKSRLTGFHREPGQKRGDFVPLLNTQREVIGAVLRTRTRVKPVYVSPGHLCDLHSAVQIVLACTTRYRLPEPIRAAHAAAGLDQQTRHK